MKRTFWAAVVSLAAVTSVIAQPVAGQDVHGVSPAVQGGDWSWAVANKPTTEHYTPDTNHQSTLIGNAKATVQRSGEGSYQVVMPVEDSEGDPVSVHVSALGGAVTHCDVDEVILFDAGFGPFAEVVVACYDRAGNRVDSKFIVNVLQPGNVAGGHIGYVMDPDQSSGTVTPTQQYNYRGFTNSVTRLSEPGQYEVIMTGITDSAGGSVQITPVLTAATCAIDRWGTEAPLHSVASLHVFIQCRAPNGARTDAGFYLTFMSQTSLKGESGSGQYYLLANKPSKTSYTPVAADQWSSTGDKATIKRSSPGAYAVTLRGMTNDGSAQVTPYGGRASGPTLDRRCAVSSIATKSTHLAAGGTAEKIGVRCYNSKGHLADSEFTLSYVK